MPTEILQTIVAFSRVNIRNISCVNVMFASVCKSRQFNQLIPHNHYTPWWVYVAKYHIKKPVLTWQEQCRAYDLWHNIFYNGDEDHDLIMQFRDVFDLDVVD